MNLARRWRSPGAGAHGTWFTGTPRAGPVDTNSAYARAVLGTCRMSPTSAEVGGRSSVGRRRGGDSLTSPTPRLTGSAAVRTCEQQAQSKQVGAH
ncbi:hypothetical protein JGU66_32495 [Myxococcaceae bacterium JPH2]|nr:hypothetical protein [Myxococcaceae bacterium JPH2]